MLLEIGSTMARIGLMVRIDFCDAGHIHVEGGNSIGSKGCGESCATEVGDGATAVVLASFLII